MAKRKRRRKPVDVKAVRAGRAAGLSYREIGDKLGVSASGAWHAEHQRPGEPRIVPAGKQRTIYLSDELWAQLGAAAKLKRLSRSLLLAVLLEERFMDV